MIAARLRARVVAPLEVMPLWYPDGLVEAAARSATGRRR
jgi:hypothetical protein